MEKIATLLEALLVERVLERAVSLRSDWSRRMRRDAIPAAAMPEEPPGKHFIDEALAEFHQHRAYIVAGLTAALPANHLAQDATPEARRE